VKPQITQINTERNSIAISNDKTGLVSEIGNNIVTFTHSYQCQSAVKENRNHGLHRLPQKEIALLFQMINKIIRNNTVVSDPC